MGILIRVLIQKNVKPELVADWEEIGHTDRKGGQMDNTEVWGSQNNTAAGMKER